MTLHEISYSTSSITFNEAIEYPYFKYILYTKIGEEITTYDKEIEVSAKMTKGNNSCDLNSIDNYIKLNVQWEKINPQFTNFEYIHVVTVCWKKYFLYAKLETSDRLNWNYLTNSDTVSASNFYGLSSK